MLSANYITTFDVDANTDVESIKKELREKYGPIRLRGRHSDRKGLYNRLGWTHRKYSQNDVPYQYAERIAVYKRTDYK